MPNPWFRLYSEFADDPKVQMMSEPMQRRLIMLFCSKCKGETLHETELAFHWRISETELAETKAVFIAKGFIDEDWNIENWNKRQFLSDSSTDRVRKYRQAKKQDETLHETPETNHTVTVTPPDTEQIQNRTEQKNLSSRRKRERESDPRHAPCRKACEMYASHKRVEFVWDGSEGKQLDLLLAATPSLTVETFQRCLNHRAKSPVAHGERPREWLGTLLRYQEGPLNQFNKPEITNGQNGAIQGHRPSNAQQRRRSGLDAIASAFPEFLRTGADGETAGDDARGLPEPGDTARHSRSVA